MGTGGPLHTLSVSSLTINTLMVCRNELKTNGGSPNRLTAVSVLPQHRKHPPGSTFTGRHRSLETPAAPRTRSYHADGQLKASPNLQKRLTTTLWRKVHHITLPFSALKSPPTQKKALLPSQTTLGELRTKESGAGKVLDLISPQG